MRSFFKKNLENTFLFGPAQKSYIFVKRLLDYVIFKFKYPRVSWLSYSEVTLNNMKNVGYFSQFGQDYYLEKLFSALRGNDYKGFFIDIGANHPYLINNSYFFEIKGWKGIAIDPIQTFVDDWRRDRVTTLFNVAISSQRGTREFVEILNKEGWENTLSGFAECIRQSDIDLYGSKLYTVNTVPLKDLLQVGQHVDLLLIDVEGAEKYVIEGASLSIIKPSVVMVENVSAIGGDDSLRNCIEREGYYLHARIGATDDIFISSLVPFVNKILADGSA